MPEHKNHVFTYALYPHAGDWREAETQHAAYEFNHPLAARQTAPAAKAYLPPEMSFVQVSPKNIILTGMKPFGNPIPAFEKTKSADAANGIMLRFYDAEGIDCGARIEFASGMKRAWAANLLEERQDDVPVVNGGMQISVPAFSIVTVGFKPGKPGPRMGRKALGTEAEPVQPVWVRSWEHDAESMPMGYGSVVCSISREVREEDEGRTLILKVHAVNDYTDAEVSGEAQLLVPEGWTAEPAVIRFQIPPLGYRTTDVTVRRPQASDAGQIKLRHEYDGQTFQDVLEVGRAFDLEMDVANEGDAILVVLKNPTEETIEAEVSMVTPIETWPKRLVGPHAILDISPRTQGVSLAPGETTTLRYSVVTPLANGAAVPQDSYWAVAKMMSNGRIHLKRCDNRPAERRLNESRWFERRQERLERAKCLEIPPD